MMCSVRQMLVVVAGMILCGCATNQLHFAPYTSPAEVARLEDTKIAAHITKVRGIEICSTCTEISKIVWHASAHAGEGFAAIPITNWEGFIRASIESPYTTPGAQDVSITIDRIFLKTFADPDYYACQVKLTVRAAGSSSSGTGVVKFEGRGQTLMFAHDAVLEPVSANAIRLALRAAYLDAASKL